MDTKNNPRQTFSLSEGGPIYNALEKMGLYDNPGKVAIICLCIAWLPLLIITLIEGTAYNGVELPFLKDAAMQGRLLIALPLLILIRPSIDGRVISVTKYISEALFKPEDRTFATAIRRARKLTSSASAEIVLLLIVIVATIILFKGGAYSGLEPGASSWMASAKEGGDHSLTFAGKWSFFFSIPLFQILLLRWLWGYTVWILFLLRLSRSNLKLLPSHADRAGGLGILILAQKSFNLIFVAMSVVISGELIAQLDEKPETFNTIRILAIVYVIFCLVLLLFPLLFFAGKLAKTKQKGLLDMSNLAAEMSQKFEKEWINDLPIEKRIEQQQVDPSMVFDYAGLYESIQKLRVVPITTPDVVGMALLLFVPFIPIPFIYYSMAEMLKRIIGLLT